MLRAHAIHFEEMRLKYSRSTGRKSPTGSMKSSHSTTSGDEDPVIEDLLLVWYLPVVAIQGNVDVTQVYSKVKLFSSEGSCVFVHRVVLEI